MKYYIDKFLRGTRRRMRPFGFFLVMNPLGGDKYIGYIELQKGTELASVFFLIADLTTSSTCHQLLMAADLDFEKIFVEALVYPKEIPGQTRFQTFDEEIASQGGLADPDLFICSMYYDLLRSQIEYCMFPQIRRCPHNEFYYVTFGPGAEQIFEKETGMEFVDFIRETNLLMPTI